MSTIGERKCAILLASVHPKDRRLLLAALPAATASLMTALVSELQKLPFSIGELAEELLGEDIHGRTTTASPDMVQLMGLSGLLTPAWFARVLSVWSGADHAFCVAMLDEPATARVREESLRLAPLPPKLLEALKVEALTLAATKDAA